MLITQLYNTNIDSYLELINKCAKGGITLLQLREKHASSEFLFKFGCKLKSISAPFNISLIVNDNVDLACKLGADGVHLGQIDGLKKVVALSKYPVVAVGGINQKNVAQVINTGVSGVAVISTIHEAKDPQKEVQQLYDIINRVIC